MEFKSLDYYKSCNIDILLLQSNVKLSRTNGDIVNISSKKSANNMLSKTVLAKNGCWDYLGHCDQKGYGLIFIGDNNITPEVRAHRLSYYLFHQEDPGKLLVLHSCDRKCCINPAHLRLGTAADNAQDAVERNRLNPVLGEANNKTRFSNKEVVEIVKRYNEIRNYKAVAEEFNTTDFCIRNIILSPTRSKNAGLDSKQLLDSDPRNKPLHEVITSAVPIKSMGGNSKLTWDIVNQIRKDYETIKSPAELGRLHNVCRKTVGKIVRNKSWVVNEETLREQREFTKEEIEAIKARYVVLKSCTKLAAELGIGINRTRRLVKT